MTDFLRRSAYIDLNTVFFSPKLIRLSNIIDVLKVWFRYMHAWFVQNFFSICSFHTKFSARLVVYGVATNSTHQTPYLSS